MRTRPVCYKLVVEILKQVLTIWFPFQILITIIITVKEIMEHRRSHKRDRILQILKETKSHPATDWIYNRLKKEIPELSLGTVYRNLEFLVEQKLIQKIPSHDNLNRFDATTDPHYHIVCQKCGAVEDLQIPQQTELNQAAQKVSLFKVTSHKIVFYGICNKCQNKPNIFKERAS